MADKSTKDLPRIMEWIIEQMGGEEVAEEDRAVLWMVNHAGYIEACEDIRKMVNAETGREIDRLIASKSRAFEEASERLERARRDQEN